MKRFSHPIGAGAAMSPGSQIRELTTKRATAKTTMMAAGRRVERRKANMNEIHREVVPILPEFEAVGRAAP